MQEPVVSLANMDAQQIYNFLLYLEPPLVVRAINESNQIKYSTFRLAYLILFQTQVEFKLITKHDYIFKLG